jgi:hypothetical protein
MRRRAAWGRCAPVDNMEEHLVALAHLSVKPSGKMSAMDKLGYITRDGRYAARLEAGEKLEAVGAGNLPAWANGDPAKFWRAADLGELGRKGSRPQIYREWEIALPRELSDEQRRALVEEFIAQEFGAVGKRCPYTYAIHNPTAADGKEQPHLHVMFCERALDGNDRTPETYFNNAKRKIDGGAPKINQGMSSPARKKMLRELRLRWGDVCNSALERAGSAERIDMRTLAERGIRRKPEPKQGPKRWNGRLGKQLILDARASRAAFERARDTLRELMPAGPRAEIARLMAGAKQQAGGVFDRMPLDKLRALVAKPPATLAQQLDADPALRSLIDASQAERMRLRGLVQEKAVLTEKAAAAAKAETDYRAANAWRAGLHDRGVQQVKALAEAQKIQRQAGERLTELVPLIELAQVQAEAARIAATERRAELVAKLEKPASEAARKHANAAETLRRREALDALVRAVDAAAKDGRQLPDAPEAARLVERMRAALALGSGKASEERKTIEQAFGGQPEAVAELRAALGADGVQRER